MVGNNSYVGTNGVFLVDAVEWQRVSNDLLSFFRDGVGEVPEDISIKNYNHPESITNLRELPSTQEGRGTASGELSRTKEQPEAGEEQIKWRYVKGPEHLFLEIVDLSVEKGEYPVQDSVKIRNEDFIAQDEIDTRLIGGGNPHREQFRIYEYFMERHDKKGNIAFLKDGYGTGGSSHVLIGSDKEHEDHDAKSIRLEKGSYRNSYAKVLLKWNMVEKHTNELVKADKYPSPGGKEAYTQYKKEQVGEAMHREQERPEHGIRIEYKNAIEQATAERFDGYIFLRNTAEDIIGQYGKEHIEIAPVNITTHLSHDGRLSPSNKEWARSLVLSADWQTRDYIITSHPVVLGGPANQTRRHIERDREPEKAAAPEREAEASREKA